MRKPFALLLILIISCAGRGKTENVKNENGKDVEKTVVVKIARPESISKTITVSGIIKGYPDINVFADMPGKLLRVNVSEGQYVRKGQILALIDRSAPGIDVQPLTVEAPTSGYVQVLLRDIGAPVSPQTPLFRIVGKDKISVLFDVPEVFASDIRVGGKIWVEGKRGRIVRVSPALDTRTRTLKVEGEINGNFIPGQSVLVEVEVKRSDSTIVLPVSAFVGDNKGYVFVVSGNIAKRVPVELGITTSEGYEVIRGLKFGDTVVVFGANVVKDGDKGKIVRFER
ncbi:MAG: efflux RND transporter periplasmic adaptor subunit [candidate division WOR-3 bacterium]